jgi:hypothetical protein
MLGRVSWWVDGDAIPESVTVTSPNRQYLNQMSRQLQGICIPGEGR